jgi:hypothetical protein
MTLAAGVQTIPTQGWVLFAIVCALLVCAAGLGLLLHQRDARRADGSKTGGGAPPVDQPSS